MKKSLLRLGVIAFAVLVSSERIHAAEDWKGKQDPRPFGFGAMMGLGVLDSTAGFTLVGTASRRIIESGWVPDINNSVSAEIELGPFISSPGNALFYSTHLRWDFSKDEKWSLYGLGGLGGFSTSSSLGSKFEFFPRFGVGGFLKIRDAFSLRAEFSHELIGFGLVFLL